jgi:hypothetical protein
MFPGLRSVKVSRGSVVIAIAIVTLTKQAATAISHSWPYGRKEAAARRTRPIDIAAIWPRRRRQLTLTKRDYSGSSTSARPNMSTLDGWASGV